MYQRNVYEHVPIWKSITIEYRSDIPFIGTHFLIDGDRH